MCACVCVRMCMRVLPVCVWVCACDRVNAHVRMNLCVCVPLCVYALHVVVCVRMCTCMCAYVMMYTSPPSYPIKRDNTTFHASSRLADHNASAKLTAIIQYWFAFPVTLWTGSSLPHCRRSTDFLREVHWLGVPERIHFRLCVLTYRCIHGTKPYNFPRASSWRSCHRPRPFAIRRQFDTSRAGYSTIVSWRSYFSLCCTQVMELTTKIYIYEMDFVFVP